MLTGADCLRQTLKNYDHKPGRIKEKERIKELSKKQQLNNPGMCSWQTCSLNLLWICFTKHKPFHFTIMEGLHHCIRWMTSTQITTAVCFFFKKSTSQLEVTAWSFSLQNAAQSYLCSTAEQSLFFLFLKYKNIQPNHDPTSEHDAAQPEQTLVRFLQLELEPSALTPWICFSAFLSQQSLQLELVSVPCFTDFSVTTPWSTSTGISMCTDTRMSNAFEKYIQLSWMIPAMFRAHTNTAPPINDTVPCLNRHPVWGKGERGGEKKFHDDTANGAAKNK